MSKKHVEPDAPGWYDDPDGHKGIERYWNGSSWSGAPREAPPKLTAGGIATMIIGTLALSVLVWWLIFS